jgi:chaperone modulatory protein CbpM
MADALHPDTSSEQLVVEEQVQFTLDQLSWACRVDLDQLIVYVQHGVLEPLGAGPDDWRFTGPALQRARTASRLQRDLEVHVSSLALVLDLLDQIDGLRRQLQHVRG